MERKSGPPADPGSAKTPAAAGAGFRGTVGSVALVDLIQVWSMNAFSGLVSVTTADGAGRIYFASGAIVHAEAGGVTGEAAVATILGWPQGSFELFPNTATLARTIEKSVSHLLLDVHRVLDERRRTEPPRGAGQAASRAVPSPGRTPADRLRSIPGVLRVVRFDPGGRPLDDPSPAAAALALRARHLALDPAAGLADAFGLRPLSVATLRGEGESLLLVRTGAQFLGLAVTADASLEDVGAQVRAVLAGAGPG